jgi:hypothetical protein
VNPPNKAGFIMFIVLTGKLRLKIQIQGYTAPKARSIIHATLQRWTGRAQSQNQWAREKSAVVFCRINPTTVQFGDTCYVSFGKKHLSGMAYLAG